MNTEDDARSCWPIPWLHQASLGVCAKFTAILHSAPMAVCACASALMQPVDDRDRALLELAYPVSDSDKALGQRFYAEIRRLCQMAE